MSSVNQEGSPRRSFFLEVLYLSQWGIFLGVIAGIIWGYGAPRSQITGAEEGQISFDPMSSAPIGADMLFMLIAFICALILVFAVYKIAFTSPLPTLFGVLIGSALGTLSMYLIGIVLGNLGNVDPTQLAVGETTNSALEINATGVFFVWIFWAALVVAFICWRRSRRLNKELKLIQAPPPVPYV